MAKQVPVYIVSGMLESGKTTFIRETLMEQDWVESGLTLLLQCEEGEYELDPAYLKERNIRVLPVEDPALVTQEYCRELLKSYKPGQIIIEFNGMWNLQEFLQKDFPKEFGLAGIYSTVNGQELELLMANMRSLFLNQLIESDLVVVNRCDRSMNRIPFRKALKLQNPGAQIIFEATDGELIEFGAEDLPYDLSQDPVIIDDVDYGTWYSDALENPERYQRKRFRFLCQLFRPTGMPRNMFVPGRLIMACCPADIQFYGFPCKADAAFSFAQKSWATVTVEFRTERIPGPNGAAEEAPVLRLISREPAEKPAEEVVSL